MVLNPKHTVGRNNARPSNPEVNRAFSAGVLMRCHESWGAAPGWRLNAAPLALNTYAAPWHLGCTFMRCVREQDERADSTRVNRVHVPLFPRLPPVQTSGTGYHAVVGPVCAVCRAEPSVATQVVGRAFDGGSDATRRERRNDLAHRIAGRRCRAAAGCTGVVPSIISVRTSGGCVGRGRSRADRGTRDCRSACYSGAGCPATAVGAPCSVIVDCRWRMIAIVGSRRMIRGAVAIRTGVVGAFTITGGCSAAVNVGMSRALPIGAGCSPAVSVGMTRAAALGVRRAATIDVAMARALPVLVRCAAAVRIGMARALSGGVGCAATVAVAMA